MSYPHHHSQACFEEAKRYMPGGVSSPVRAFQAVGGHPLFIKRGEGSHLIDVDDHRYIDYVCSWGPLIVGHAHPYVVSKVTEVLANGFSFGACTEIEVKLAKAIAACMPALQLIRFVSSGTEAAMSAIRLARGFTKRNKIIKFAGCYHGHADSLLVNAGSGALTFGVPSSAGVTPGTAADTLVADFNALDQVEFLFKQQGADIAAVIVEPIAANANLILPEPGFLPGLRELCHRYDALLIFDEVITGFRVGLGGAQGYYGITPDLTILGKIIGGGLPAAAFGGRRDVMQCLAPLGPVYQAGTLSGNPIAMTAGLATIALLQAPDFYPPLALKTAQLSQGFAEQAAIHHIPLQVAHIASLFGFCFMQPPLTVNIDLFNLFFHAMLKAGIYLAPSAFEVGFVSSAHTDADITQTIAAAANVFSWLAEKRMVIQE